jgi:hypothetical protein
MIRQMQSAGAVTVPEVAIDPAHPLVDRSAVARPIRVAHLIHTIAHGGVETALINWCRTFDPVRVQAHLLCFADPGASEAPFVAAADRAGLHVDRVPWGRSKPVRRAARAVAALLRDRQIDLLHCHNTYANAVGLVAARLTPVRTLTTVYVWSGYGIKRRALQWIDERLLGYFDQVTAHCDAALRATVKRGIPASGIRLLTCGFADRVARLYAHEWEEGRRALGVGPDDTVLIKVARFWPEKRHDILLRAFRLMLQREPNLQLWIPGVGPEETRCALWRTNSTSQAAADFSVSARTCRNCSRWPMSRCTRVMKKACRSRSFPGWPPQANRVDAGRGHRGSARTRSLRCSRPAGISGGVRGGDVRPAPRSAASR